MYSVYFIMVLFSITVLQFYFYNVFTSILGMHDIDILQISYIFQLILSNTYINIL